MEINMNFTEQDIRDLANCVMITVMHREQDNEDRWLFEDDESKKVDPILDRLKVLNNRLYNMIDKVIE